MRRRTRNAVLVLLGILVVLVALGALPGLLASGDPYRLTVTPAGEWDADDETLAASDQQAVTASNLSGERFPYTTAALANASATEAGQSHPYRTGYVGLKEAFTHSPFDERDALGQRNSDATTDDGVYVHHEGTVYHLTVTQEEV